MGIIAKRHEQVEFAGDRSVVRIEKSRLIAAAALGTLAFVLIAFALPLLLF